MGWGVGGGQSVVVVVVVMAVAVIILKIASLDAIICFYKNACHQLEALLYIAIIYCINHLASMVDH